MSYSTEDYWHLTRPVAINQGSMAPRLVIDIGDVPEEHVKLPNNAMLMDVTPPDSVDHPKHPWHHIKTKVFSP